MSELLTISESKHNIDRWTSRVLRVGVYSSALLMIFGLVFAVINPESLVNLSTVNLEQLAIKIFSGEFDPVVLMFSGLVLLMFTPILRVITTVIGFAIEKDWRFVAVSIIVLLMLTGEILYSIIIKG